MAGTQAQEEKVIFSSKGGFYDNSFPLTLACYYPNHHVRYTTNGNAPNANSPLFEEPLLLDRQLYSKSDIYTIKISPERLVFIPDSVQHAIVIRAAVFDDNERCISNVFTNTYLIKELGCDTHGLAMLSICADSLDLFDYDTGILVPGAHWDPDWPENTGNYFQQGREWERPANMEFYEPTDNSGVNQECGLRTHGHIGRIYPAKCLKVFAREEYGKKRFKHPFFNDSPLKSFNHLVLKPFTTDWTHSGTPNHLSNLLAMRIGLDAPHSRPVLLFLNGEYWGIYFIQEKMDECYLEDHYGIDKCNIIGDWFGEAEYGNNDSFNAMMDWLENADLSVDANYAHLSQQIDVDNYIDYVVFETYISNTDWPGNNMRCWQEGNGPWRWLFFDGDQSLINQDFDAFENAIYTGPATLCNNQKATLLFRRLLENNQFNERFAQRLNELCCGPLQYDSIAPLFQEIRNILRPEIPNMTQRFGYPESMDYWNWTNSLINRFLQQRTNAFLVSFENFIPAQIHHFQSETDQFICYPNPTCDEINVTMLDGRSRLTNILVYDLNGTVRLCEEKYLAPCSAFALGKSLRPGVYVIKIGPHTKTFVKY